MDMNNCAVKISIHEKNRRSKKILKTHSTKFRRLKASLVNGICWVRISSFFFYDEDAQTKEQICDAVIKMTSKDGFIINIPR